MSRRAKLRLVGEILATYVSARWYLRSGTLPTAVERLRAAPAPPERTTVAVDEARLARAVARTLSTLPTDSRCLLRSLVMLRLLARRGIEAALVIAARPDPSEPLEAHAWVEVAGRPVLPPADAGYGRLVTL